MRLEEIILVKSILKRLWVQVANLQATRTSIWFGFTLRTTPDKNKFYPAFLVKIGEKI